MMVKVNKCKGSFLSWFDLISNAYVHRMLGRMLIYTIVNTNMSRDIVPCVVGTTEYSIANEHVVVQTVLQKISKSLSLMIALPKISQEFLLGFNHLFLSFQSPKVLLLLPPVSLLFLYLNERLLWETFPCSSFFNDDFAGYFAPLATLSIYCVVTSLGWAA